MRWVRLHTQTHTQTQTHTTSLIYPSSPVVAEPPNPTPNNCPGDGKAALLQNHGILTVGHSVDEAACWFLSLDKTCPAQLLIDAAARGSGRAPHVIPDKEAEETYRQVGTPEKGWLAFQGYYDEVVRRTGGEFLR